MKDVDARDIGAKQSFVASPGHDEWGMAVDVRGTSGEALRLRSSFSSKWPPSPTACSRGLTADVMICGTVEYVVNA